MILHEHAAPIREKVMKFNKASLPKDLETAMDRNEKAIEILYMQKANRYGVQYIGLNKKHRLALFQDPVSGSSFGIRTGECIESGIQRVRERFGLGYI